jgi:hypothetical protein
LLKRTNPSKSIESLDRAVLVGLYAQAGCVVTRYSLFV